MRGKRSWRAESLISVSILVIATGCGSSSGGAAPGSGAASGGGAAGNGAPGSGAQGNGAAGSGGAGGANAAGSPGVVGTGGAQAATPPADAPRDCGSLTCAPDEWCKYPCCGTYPSCMPSPGADGGTCPVGYASCFYATGITGCRYTCTIPSCSKDAPAPGCMIAGRQVRCTCE